MNEIVQAFLNKSTLMFDTKTGEITKYSEKLYWSYNNWYYISEYLYPVYDNNVYIGYYENNTFCSPGDR